MQAIATLINANSDLTSTKLWQTLTHSCDLNGIRMPENPHFSWMVAERFEEEAVEEIFASFARNTKEFEIHTNGLGIFTGEKPILYLPIVKTETLLEMHKEIWRTIFPLGVNQNNVYHPSHWIPHITIIGDGVSADRLSCLLESILPLSLDMKISVNNLSVIYSEEKDAGIRFIQEFGKEGE